MAAHFYDSDTHSRVLLCELVPLSFSDSVREWVAMWVCVCVQRLDKFQLHFYTISHILICEMPTTPFRCSYRVLGV